MRYQRLLLAPFELLLATTLLGLLLTTCASASRHAGLNRQDDGAWAFADDADDFSSYNIPDFTPWSRPVQSASHTTASSASATSHHLNATSASPITPLPQPISHTAYDPPSSPSDNGALLSPPDFPEQQHTMTAEQLAADRWSTILKLSSSQIDFSTLTGDLLPMIPAAFSIPASLWLNLHRANTKQPQSFFNLHLPIFGSILFGLGALVQQLRGPQQLEYHANLMSTSAALSYLTAVLTGFACLPVLLWLVIFHPAPIAAMILVKQGSRLPLNFTWLSSLGRRPLTMAWKTTHQWRSPAFDPTRASLLVLAVLVPVFEVTWRCAFVDHYQQGLRLQHASAIMQIVFAALRGFTLFVDARKALPRDGTLKARLLAIAAIEVALLIALVSDIVSLCIPVSIESPFFRNLRALGYFGYLFTSLLLHHACLRLDCEPTRPPTTQRRSLYAGQPWPKFESSTLSTPSSAGSLQVPFSRYIQNNTASGGTLNQAGPQDVRRLSKRIQPPGLLDHVQIRGTTEFRISSSSSRPAAPIALEESTADGVISPPFPFDEDRDDSFPEQMLSPVSTATALRPADKSRNQPLMPPPGIPLPPLPNTVRRKPAPAFPYPPAAARRKPWATPRLASLVRPASTPSSRDSSGSALLMQDLDAFPKPPVTSAPWSKRLARNLSAAATARRRNKSKTSQHSDIDAVAAAALSSTSILGQREQAEEVSTVPTPWAASEARPETADTHRTHVTVTSFFNWQQARQHLAQQTQQQPRKSGDTGQSTTNLRSSNGFPAVPGRAFFGHSNSNGTTSSPPRLSAASPSCQQRGGHSSASGDSGERSTSHFPWRDSALLRNRAGSGASKAGENPFAAAADSDNEEEAQLDFQADPTSSSALPTTLLTPDSEGGADPLVSLASKSHNRSSTRTSVATTTTSLSLGSFARTLPPAMPSSIYTISTTLQNRAGAQGPAVGGTTQTRRNGQEVTAGQEVQEETDEAFVTPATKPATPAERG